jgi:hypothetical protein
VIDKSQVTVIIPTRGNVPMDGILESLEGFGQVIVADNSKLPEDLGIYARFAAIKDAEFDVIATQDDDIIFRHWEELLALYKPGVFVTAYPQPCDGPGGIPWISTGAVFHKDLPFKAFNKYLEHYPFDHFLTHRAADAVFCLLTPFEIHPMPYEELGWAKDDGRVHTSEGWYDRDRPLAWDRCLAIR